MKTEKSIFVYEEEQYKTYNLYGEIEIQRFGDIDQVRNNLRKSPAVLKFLDGNELHKMFPDWKQSVRGLNAGEIDYLLQNRREEI